MQPADIWASAPYGPTAERLAPAADLVAERVADRVGQQARAVDIGAGHGSLCKALLAHGLTCLAIEPVAAMREVGQAATPTVEWREALGEDTGLGDATVDAVASSFGTMFCAPDQGPAEWARILRPDGLLVMTAWDDRGFLAEMTARMADIMYRDREPMRHMSWGDDEVARNWLAGHFKDVEIEHLDLPWSFSSVEEGMRLYLDGSPSHSFSFRVAGERRDELVQALEDHLHEHTGPDGTIEATAGYALISARRSG